MTKIYSRDEIAELLKAARLETGMSRRELAEALGCAEATIKRLETGETVVSDEMWNRCIALCILGQRYDPGATEEKVGTTAGVGTGIAGATTAVSAAGVTKGLSGAGMAAGLKALGLGSMATGIGVVAAIPVGLGLVTYGVVKAIKAIARANKLDAHVEEIDDQLEFRLKPAGSESPDAPNPNDRLLP